MGSTDERTSAWIETRGMIGDKVNPVFFQFYDELGSGLLDLGSERDFREDKVAVGEASMEWQITGRTVWLLF